MLITRRKLRNLIKEEVESLQNNEYSEAEISLSKWVNEPAAKYARLLIDEFGQPDGVTEDMVIWTGRISKFDNVYVKDEYIYHESPSPHYDYAYSTLTIHVPEDLMGAVAEASESIIIDQLKDTVTARCADIYANAITLGFVQKLASGKVSPENAKEEYEHHIKNKILPAWFQEFNKPADDDQIKEVKMNRRRIEVTRRQLRRIIKEAIDVVNDETGEVIEFGDMKDAAAPEAALDNILKRLSVKPKRSETIGLDGGGVEKTMYFNSEDYDDIYHETQGKRDMRSRKRARAQFKASEEEERQRLDRLLDRLSDWAQDAAAEYLADNPGTDLQDIAYDLADAWVFEFRKDEQEELLGYFDGDLNDLKIYAAESMG